MCGARTHQSKNINNQHDLNKMKGEKKIRNEQDLEKNRDEEESPSSICNIPTLFYRTVPNLEHICSLPHSISNFLRRQAEKKPVFKWDSDHIKSWKKGE